MIDETYLDKDYNKMVREKFPCPENLREIEYGENLPNKTVIYDRTNMKSKVFCGWNETTGQIKVAYVSYDMPILEENHCWYLVQK